jgi:hypothetical protein
MLRQRQGKTKQQHPAGENPSEERSAERKIPSQGPFHRLEDQE